MRRDGPRRFTLLDVMAIVIAFAAGLAISRSFGDFKTVRRQVDVNFRSGENGTSTIGVSSSDYISRSTADFFKPPIRGHVIYWGRQLAFWPAPCLAVLSLMTLILSLWSAQQSGDRLATAPGTATCLVVTLAMATAAVRLPHLLLPRVVPGQAYHPRWAEWWLEFWFTVPRLGGFAVAACWVGMAFVGHLRAGGSWLNRLGLVLGAGWISMAVMDLVSTWAFAFPY